MAETRPLRRLAAILVADVVGYSRFMEADEVGALAALRQLRSEVVEPLVEQHSGRIVKTMGDGVLVEFASAVNAVNCALAVQARMSDGSAPGAARMSLRIGINLGDVVEEDADIYGDGINVATRLEALSPPGGICIAANVHEAVSGKINIAVDDLGERVLKNIARPVRAYIVRKSADGKPRVAAPPLSLPDKPSIAVLAFENLSGEPEQDYFADGIVEEIITALSRVKWLFVIARNSSFAYRGRRVDVKQIGAELGVRYVLQGSVRKSGSRVRINGQLVDASAGLQIWADRFDGELADVFDLQDQVTMRVVGEISPKLEEAEIERALRKPTDNLDAYQCHMRGMAGFYRLTEEGNREGLAQFYRAIDIDPNFASAVAMAARSYAQRKAFGWPQLRSDESAEVERLARRAASLGKDDAVVLTMAGIALAYSLADLEGGESLINRAVSLNPNLASAWFFSGWVKVLLGDSAAALERLARAMRLSPQDPNMYNMHTATAAAHFIAGNYHQAMSSAAAAVENQPNFVLANSLLAASAGHCGDASTARNALARLLHLVPQLHVKGITDLFPVRRGEDLARLADGLRKAGMPDD
jgi:adenylate cyclase